VEAFGHVGFKVERAEDLEPAMREAFSDKLKRRTVFVDVWVDPSEHVYPMAIKGGAMRDMYLARRAITTLGEGAVLAGLGAEDEY
jgi:acetolactate synthase I/II/III large subunit